MAVVYASLAYVGATSHGAFAQATNGGDVLARSASHFFGTAGAYLIAAIVASYKGMNADGGPKGVGDAVNEAVVITFVLLCIANFVMSLIYLQVVPPKTG